MIAWLFPHVELSWFQGASVYVDPFDFQNSPGLVCVEQEPEAGLCLVTPLIRGAAHVWPDPGALCCKLFWYLRFFLCLSGLFPSSVPQYPCSL